MLIIIVLFTHFVWYQYQTYKDRKEFIKQNVNLIEIFLSSFKIINNLVL